MTGVRGVPRFIPPSQSAYKGNWHNIGDTHNKIRQKGENEVLYTISSIMRNWRRIGLTTLMVSVLSLSLAACGGDPAPAAPTSTPEAQATEQPTGTPAASVETATPGPIAPGATTPESAGGSADTGTPSAASCAKLNLNEETEDQLMSTIPGFSARMVREFF